MIFNNLFYDVILGIIKLLLASLITWIRTWWRRGDFLNLFRHILVRLNRNIFKIFLMFYNLFRLLKHINVSFTINRKTNILLNLNLARLLSKLYLFFTLTLYVQLSRFNWQRTFWILMRLFLIHTQFNVFLLFSLILFKLILIKEWKLQTNRHHKLLLFFLILFFTLGIILIYFLNTHF